MGSNTTRLRVPLVPERVRRIAGQGFGFIPHRFLGDGFLSSLDRDELALYLFLVLAANRDGVSFYGYVLPPVKVRSTSTGEESHWAGVSEWRRC